MQCGLFPERNTNRNCKSNFYSGQNEDRDSNAVSCFWDGTRQDLSSRWYRPCDRSLMRRERSEQSTHRRPNRLLPADRRIMKKQSTDTALCGVRKTIGHTTYVVSVHGNEKSRENVKNKLKRIILNDRKALRITNTNQC